MNSDHIEKIQIAFRNHRSINDLQFMKNGTIRSYLAHVDEERGVAAEARHAVRLGAMAGRLKPLQSCTVVQKGRDFSDYSPSCSNINRKIKLHSFVTNSLLSPIIDLDENYI